MTGGAALAKDILQSGKIGSTPPEGGGSSRRVKDRSIATRNELSPSRGQCVSACRLCACIYLSFNVLLSNYLRHILVSRVPRFRFETPEKRDPVARRASITA